LCAAAGAMCWLTAGIPQPTWILYGQAVDEYGWPYLEDAAIELSVNGAVVKRYDVAGSVRPGVNFVFRLPMDSGTGSRYDGAAARTGDTFSINLLTASGAQPIMEPRTLPPISQPGSIVHLNVTAGTDLDQDGLPDEWEEWILFNAFDPDATLWDVHGNDDFDGDGVSNLNEYRSGTDPAWDVDYFRIEYLQHDASGRLALTLFSVPGKAYRLLASPTPATGGELNWQEHAYAKSPSGEFQTGSFEGSGYYMTIYIDGSSGMKLFRVAAQ